MNIALTILRGPIDSGVLYPQAWLATVLLVFKLFDAWSTNYIVGRKGGVETGPLIQGRRVTLALWLIEKTGSVQRGIAADFLLVAACGWLCYPYWPLLAGLVAWYGYWMALQVAEWRKARDN